jgi:peroxiredoxin
MSLMLAGLGDGSHLEEPVPSVSTELPHTVLSVGSEAPDARLLDIEGTERALLDGTTLVIFYKGGWCPYCNGHLRDLAGVTEALKERGVSPVAVSVDLPDHAAVTEATWELPFPVLSDPELVAHEAYGVVTRLKGPEKVMLGLAGAGIRDRSGRDDGAMAIPSLFLVNEGRIAWAHADLELKERPSMEAVLSAIDAALQ